MPVEIKNHYTGDIIYTHPGDTLAGANLLHIKLQEADLRGVDLRGADLRGSGLFYVDLSNADLSRANLQGSALRYSNLTGAEMRSANLRVACLGGTTLDNANLPVIPFDPIPETELARQILQRVDRDKSVLVMNKWHAGETTHSAWGWAIILNGAPGRKLEKDIGTSVAGALLFPSFAPYVFASDDKAIAKLREIASRG